MTKRSNSQQDHLSNNDASRSILSQLLSEFRERQLTASDLRSTYKGLPPKELRDRSISEGISEVDFDLAISDLTSHSLIDTGPKEHVKNDPYSEAVFIGFFTSKNEYSYLTEDGYREAVRLASSDRETRASAKSAAQRAIIHGDQYINYGQAGAIGPHSTGTINFQQQWGAIQNQVDLNALTGELEQLRKHLQQSASLSSDYQQLALLSQAEEHAKTMAAKQWKFFPKLGRVLSQKISGLQTAEALGVQGRIRCGLPAMPQHWQDNPPHQISAALSERLHPLSEFMKQGSAKCLVLRCAPPRITRNTRSNRHSE